MNHIFSVVATVSLVLVPKLGIADIVPLAQLRQIVVGGSVNTIDESVSLYETRPAEFFGPFDEHMGLALRTEFGTATADGFVAQVSTIYANEISVDSSADSFVFAPNPEDTGYASTVSQFSLSFELTMAGWYHLTASGFAQNSATSMMTLNDADAQNIVSFDASTDAAVDQVLHLPTGTYGLTAYADSSGFFEFGFGNPDGRSEIHVRLTQMAQVPEPTSMVLAVLGGAMLLGRATNLNRDWRNRPDVETL